MKIDTPLTARISSLVFGVLREVRVDQSVERINRCSFFLGYGDETSNFRSGMGVEWWRTARYTKVLRALSRAMLSNFRLVAHFTLEDAEKAIEIALQDNPLNRLYVDKFFGDPCAKLTLFDVYCAHSTSTVAETLWLRILRHLNGETDDWLFVYPLERLAVVTTRFEELGACFLATQDVNAYESYCVGFDRLRDLSLKSGKLRGGISLSSEETPSWLFIQFRGSASFVFQEAKRRASMILGTTLAISRALGNSHALTPSAATPRDYAVVISKGNSDYSFRAQSCGVLLHAVFGRSEITESSLRAATAWFGRRQLSSVEKQNRADTAARWINQAAPESEHVRFLFFFFAIDALFGERGNVEATIVQGVRKILTDKWAQKCGWLFQLRSELVHGGTASSKEWKRYEAYRDHFQSEPEEDIEELAAHCLAHFFD